MTITEYIEQLGAFVIADYAAYEHPYRKDPEHPETYSDYNQGWNDACDYIRDKLETMPVSDVSEVVRCKDCAWCHPIEDLNYCENPNAPWIDDPDFDEITVADDDFCSYGERRTMAEYISKESAISIFRAKAEMGVCTPAQLYFDNAAKILELLPAKDVAPVRHGMWKEYGVGVCCTNCGISLFHQDENNNFGIEPTGFMYCPYCGARMDGAANA